ncbi:MAG: prolyl oligopeptidase family protein [Saprospiraceae bacterium]
MRIHFFGSLFVLSLLVMSCGAEVDTTDKPSVTYPVTKQDSSVVDDYHGTQIADPYRWLEDDRSAETASWVNEQNAVTQDYLSTIPFRENIKKRLERLYDFERFGVPQVVDDWLYYSKNDGLQDQSILYRESASAENPVVELVLDPNTFSADNTTSLSGYSFSNNGAFMSYQISEGGSDWKTIKVLDLGTLEPLKDEIDWVKFSGMSWWKDGFFYSRYPAPTTGSELSNKNEGHQLYYHALGSPQSQDVLVFEDPTRPQRNVYASVSDDERWLTLNTSISTSGNDVQVADLTNVKALAQLKFKPIVSGYDHDYNLIGSRGDELYFFTNDGAPNGALRSIKPGVSKQWRNSLKTPDGAVLKSVTMTGDQLYVRTLENVSSHLYSVALGSKNSSLQEVELPGIGTTSGISASNKGGDRFFSFSSFTTPGSIYRIDEKSGNISEWRASDNGFDASIYETKQIRYTSKDGTEVPMFIVHRKGLELDGKRPTLIYGYGGFNIAIEPKHAVMRLDLVSPLLEQGGVFALANIRGGSEFGSEWHEAGTKGQKQNVFDDFIGAAEYLQSEGYTSPKRTAIYGRSNGGLLVGACITQRPDLFGIAFPAVGVLDMLRYHQFTIGWAWAGDYGRADSVDAFKYLRAYSPLHNATPKNYPSTMVTTADHDDRVVPAHSFKFAAQLQQVQQANNPVLIRIDKSSGHGAGKPVAKQIEEATDLLSFMLHEMDVDYKDPSK